MCDVCVMCGCMCCARLNGFCTRASVDEQGRWRCGVEGGKGEGGRMEGTASTVQMSSFGPYQYENQTIVGGIWNSTLMLDWPSWSDMTGKISQPLEAFTPPQGWAWAQDWVISPDVR